MLGMSLGAERSIGRLDTAHIDQFFGSVVIADVGRFALHETLVMGSDSNDKDSLVNRLPTVYAVAWRLRATGSAHDAIAGALGVEVDAVPKLLEIAERKMEELSVELKSDGTRS